MGPERIDFEVIIIGGGPAGLSAALWCRELGLNAALFEQEKEVGGQLLWTYNSIRNYLGTNAGSGRELRDIFVRQLVSRAVPNVNVIGVRSADLSNKTVTLDDGTRHSAHVIVIATGVRRRSLGVPGEAEFQGKGVLHSGVGSKNDMAGKKIVIVGGGDAAIENAIILSEHARQVTVVHRRKELRARAEFAEKAGQLDNVGFRLGYRVRALNGHDSLREVEIEGLEQNDRASIAADAILVRIGVLPNTELVRGQVALDDDGYVQVDSTGAASLDGIFAIGDVANPQSPTISTAVGDGATAIKSAKLLIDRSKNV